MSVRVLETHESTTEMTPRKQQKLRFLLHHWPPSRALATVRQVAELTGFLLPVDFALRPEKLFSGPLLATVGMPQSAVSPIRCCKPV